MEADGDEGLETETDADRDRVSSEHRHTKRALQWLCVGCLTSQGHASVSQGPVFSDKFTCCHTETEGGRNSSVGSAWARCPQRRGFDSPLGTFSGRGDFSLGVNMGSNSIPPKTPSDESINRGLVCAHMHFITRTQKILTFMS